MNSITLKKQAENDNEVITKSYVDQFHQENERSRRHVGLEFYDESHDLVKNNQDKDLNDFKLSNLESITVNRDPTSDNELANKKYIDDELDKKTSLRFHQTFENHLKVSVGNYIYNLTKYDKIQLIDESEKRWLNAGQYMLSRWSIKSVNKVGGGKIGNFPKSTKTCSPTSHSGALILPPIGNSFMYIETSSKIHGKIVFVSFERRDIFIKLLI